MQKSPLFLVLDGNALLHRAWHALPPLSTKDGVLIHAAYGFAMVVEKMREKFKPDYMVVAWDLPGKTFRHEKAASYKATREKKEQELYDQIPMIQKVLRGFHIPSLDAPGFEADDILGTLSTKAEKAGFHTLIVTGDLDALQLVTEKTHVVTFQKGISETKIYDIEAVKERYGLTPKELIDYKALRGDTSDNIAGVAGIGEKTATILIQAYGSIDGIFQALEKGEMEEKMAKKLRGKESIARDAYELVTIVLDVPLDFAFESAKTQEPDWNAVMELYRKMEFRTLLKKHEGKQGNLSLPQPAEKKPERKSTTPPRALSVLVIREVEELKQQLATFNQSETVGILLASQQQDLFGATIAAVAVSNGQVVIVVPNPAEKHMQVVCEQCDHHKQLVGHDVKTLLHQLSVFSKLVNRPSSFFDTMLAAYVLNASLRSYDLPSVLEEYLKIQLPDLPATYATQKDYQQLGFAASLLPKLSKQLSKELDQKGVKSVFEDLEIPLVPVLFKMEQAGIQVDTKALDVFSVELKARILDLEKRIRTSADNQEVNVNSPIQLADVLFEKLKLPTKGIKKTKTGYSTAASELEKLWEEHEIIPMISEYRELAKLQSTYVEALPKLVDKEGRIHTTYNQTVAATGRLSSSEPNLQNIPIKTELGREIRKAFVAPTGKVLIAADYSQIELRLAAVIAKDKPFIEAFQSGADIHTRTASEVWDVAESEVTKEQRRAAKAINFGILYGMGSRALSRATNLSMSEAKVFIEKYFEIHHAIKTYLDETKAKAHEDGYVETLFGRRRYFPEIESGVPMLVAQAERMAINMPIQGTAADLMKKAMLAVDGWLVQTKSTAVLLLQVHDELILEVEKDDVDRVAKGIRDLMEAVAQFDVPLMVDVEVGKNWGEMSEVE